MAQDVATTGLGLAEELHLVEEAGSLSIKGYNYSNIAEILEISPYKAKQYVQEYFRIIKNQAEEDPYFLERVQQNTIRFLNELDEISKEAWETVNVATDNGMVTARTQALKLALDVATKKAQLHQLMGGTKPDSEYIARMQKAESVNQILSEVLRDVVSDCERCRDMARIKLAEAFSLMDNAEGEESDGVVEDAEFDEYDV
jgi:predicted transcriptional regulator